MATKKQNREWYQKNKTHHKEKVTLRKKELNDWLWNYKCSLKCEECGINRPEVLVFHHKDPKEKDLDISTAVRKNCWSKERILKEINKCKVLCANCHAILHFKNLTGNWCNGSTTRSERDSEGSTPSFPANLKT